MQPNPWPDPAKTIVLAPAGCTGYRLIRGDIRKSVLSDRSLLIDVDRVNPYAGGGLKRWRITALFSSDTAAEEGEKLLCSSPLSETRLEGIVGLIGIVGDDVEVWGNVGNALNAVSASHRLFPVSKRGEVPALYLLE